MNLPRPEELTTLEIYDLTSAITPKDLSLIIAGVPNVTTLILSDVDFTYQECIPKLLCGFHLKTLYINDMYNPLRLILKSTKLEGLEYLSISDSDINPTQFERLRSTLHLPNLKVLSISSSGNLRGDLIREWRSCIVESI